MYKILLTTVFATVILGLFGQSSMNSTQFLNKHITTITSEFSSQQKNSYKAESFNPSWIDEMELRTETDEFDFGRQEYLFRLSPLTPKIRKAQRNLLNSYQQKLQLGKYDIIENALEQAYDLWLNAYTTQQKITIYKELLIIYNDQQKVIQKQINLPDFRIQDFLDIKEDINDLEIRIKQQEEKIKNLKTQIATLSNEQVTIDWRELPELDQVKSIINEPIDMANLNLSDKEEQQVEQKILQQEYDLEIAEKNKIFDFIQAKYRGPHDNQFRERASIGLGIRIPTLGDRKLKLEEIKLEMAREQNQLKQAEIETLADLTTQKLGISEDIKQYEIYLELKDEEIKHIKAIVDRFTKEEGFSPSLQLEINELNKKHELKQVEMKSAILEEYIDYIIQSGKAIQIPYINYLSADLESF